MNFTLLHTDINKKVFKTVQDIYGNMSDMLHVDIQVLSDQYIFVYIYRYIYILL